MKPYRSTTGHAYSAGDLCRIVAGTPDHLNAICVVVEKTFAPVPNQITKRPAYVVTDGRIRWEIDETWLKLVWPQAGIGILKG